MPRTKAPRATIYLAVSMKFRAPDNIQDPAEQAAGQWALLKLFGLVDTDNQVIIGTSEVRLAEQECGDVVVSVIWRNRGESGVPHLYHGSVIKREITLVYEEAGETQVSENFFLFTFPMDSWMVEVTAYDAQLV